MEDMNLYNKLMAQVNAEQDFGCRKMSDKVYGFFGIHSRIFYMVNTETKKVYEIRNGSSITAFTKDDIDFDVVGKMEHHSSANYMEARYYFGIDNFENGVALVIWTLYPDGEYFMDEDGYGMEDNPEINIYAYIDENCRVLIPFTDMEGDNLRKEYERKAIQKLKLLNHSE